VSAEEVVDGLGQAHRGELPEQVHAVDGGAVGREVQHVLLLQRVGHGRNVRAGPGMCLDAPRQPGEGFLDYFLDYLFLRPWKKYFTVKRCLKGLLILRASLERIRVWPARIRMKGL